jgi:hypothetical protein
MLNPVFSREDVRALEYKHYHHPCQKVQQRMEALYLQSQGLAHQEIRR